LERRNGTTIRFTMRFSAAAESEKSRRYVAQGNEENLDRLEALLAAAV
jgi:hypothetical protein